MSFVKLLICLILCSILGVVATTNNDPVNYQTKHDITKNFSDFNSPTDLKILAILPAEVSLIVENNKFSVEVKDLGISVTKNLTLNVNYAVLNKQLDKIKADSSQSSPKILSSLSRGISEVKLVASKLAPKPEPVPAPVVNAPVPVPDYIPAPVAPTPNKRSITYCISAKGVDPSFLPELEAKLASVYSDSRGWSLGGTNTFIKVSSGCSLTVWLTAAELMPSFGAICDSMWSCTVWPNVILNFDRWRFASPAWNGGGGSLDDYRSMVINHETGHWFGFGHRFCQGAGQLAPVMQQQSISLQGCTTNPWPLPYEKASL